MKIMNTKKNKRKEIPKKTNIKDVDKATLDAISIGHLNNLLSIDDGGRPTKKRACN